MDLTRTILDVIDARSFSSVWYWLVLAVIWSTSSYFVLGVPNDMIQRARRHDGQAEADLQTLIDLNIRRLTYILDTSGLVLMGLWAFVLTALLLLAFWYWIEFAQAVVLIAIPMTLIGAMTVRTAQRLSVDRPDGAPLHRILLRHRFWSQVVGMVSIFVTAMFGMYQNLYVVHGY